MKDPLPRPPRWIERFLEWYCRPELLEDLQGDLNEYFQRNAAARGLRVARLIYLIDVLKFFRIYIVRTPKFLHPMNHLSVFHNYLKTSLRSLKKNKLFSTINVLGMAISMSVGLLLITLVSELKHFDTFHEHYDRIFRIVNTYQGKDNTPEEFASTSILAGQKIRGSVPGVEEVLVINRSFNRDLTYKGKSLSLKGLWASEEFFRLFSFDLLQGNTETALQAPHSLVITESSALKLFDSDKVIGKTVVVYGENFTITGLVKDPPLNSHIRFEMLGSLTTMDQKMQAEQNESWLKWTNMWNNYVYLLLPNTTDLASVRERLASISREENSKLEGVNIQMDLQPLKETVISSNLSNQFGYSIDKSLIWFLAILAMVVILSACFNYTNLSVARALRRSREVGIRKVAGASRQQVFLQFILEAVIIAALSLLFSFALFLLIRPEFLAIDPKFLERIVLLPTLPVYLYFGLLALLVGLVAGFFPALFFSKVDPVQALKDIGQLKLFKHINVRKGLITFQYVLSICFIVAISIAYKQYKYSLNFDLGFRTENILNVSLQGNSSDLIKREFGQLPEVSGIAASMMVPSVGDTYSTTAKYLPAADSIRVYYNVVDEHYIPLHDYTFLAGNNFRAVSSPEQEESEIIINEKTLKRFNLGAPAEAIGKVLEVDGKNLLITGVVKDFHFSTLNDPIGHFVFRQNPRELQVLNLKIASDNILTTMDRLQAAWKKVDPVHPFEASFFDDAIQMAYGEYSAMVKIIGFLAVLAISIASLGLLGMVVFTTETRLREISIRKVFGASEGSLVVLLSRGFIIILFIACGIAIPLTYLFFDKMVFAGIVYRAPIGFAELFLGSFLVIGIALLAISSQTIRVARANPAEVLGRE